MDPIILLSDDSDLEDVIITDVKIRKKSFGQPFMLSAPKSNAPNEAESDEDIVFVSSVKPPTCAPVVSPVKPSVSGNGEGEKSIFLQTQPDNRNIGELSCSDELPDLHSVCNDVWNSSGVCQAANSPQVRLDNLPAFADEEISLKPVPGEDFNKTSTVNTSELSLMFSSDDNTNVTLDHGKSLASTNSLTTQVSRHLDVNWHLQGDHANDNKDITTSEQGLKLDRQQNNSNEAVNVDTEGQGYSNSHKDDASVTLHRTGNNFDMFGDDSQTGNSTHFAKSPINIMPDIYLFKDEETVQKSLLDIDDSNDNLPVLSFENFGKSDVKTDENRDDNLPSIVADSVKSGDISENADKIGDKEEKSHRKADKGKRLKLKLPGSSSVNQKSKAEVDLSDDDGHCVTTYKRPLLKNASEIKVDEGASTSGLYITPSSPISFRTPNSKSPVAMVKPLVIRRKSSENVGRMKDKSKKEKVKQRAADYVYKLAKHEHKKQKHKRRLAELKEKLKKRRRDYEDKIFAVKDFDLVMSQLNKNPTVVPKIKLGVTAPLSSIKEGSKKKRSRRGFVCNPPNCKPPNGPQRVHHNRGTKAPPVSPLNIPSTITSAPAVIPSQTNQSDTLASAANNDYEDPMSPSILSSDPFLQAPINTANPVATSTITNGNNTAASTGPLSTDTQPAKVPTTSPQVVEGTFRKLKLKLDLANSHIEPKKQRLSDTGPISKSVETTFYSADVCYYCGMSKPKAELSSCTKDHVCCGKCLEEHTKALLLGKSLRPSSCPLSGEKTSEGDVLTCSKLLSTLINVCKEHYQKTQVIEVTQKLIDASIEIDAYIATLSRFHIKVTRSSLNMGTLLKKCLPLIRYKLIYGSLQLEHLRPPPMRVVDQSLTAQVTGVSGGQQDSDPRSTWSLQCRYPKCNSYFPMSELRKTLPNMVVDMLEEKLDRSFLDFMSEELMKQVDGDGGDKTPPQEAPEVVDVPDVTEDQQAEQQAVLEVTVQDPKEVNDFPETWTRMEEDKEFEVVPVAEDTEEYWVQSARFHDTMFFPKNEIVSIKRVQNPMLWKYYQLRKKKMERDVPCEEDQERFLFHGTRKEVVEAICRDNFDWRLSGSHGHAYGHGTYFAKNASYSHAYCLDWNTPYLGKLNLPGRLQGNRRILTKLKQQRRAALAAGLPAPTPHIHGLTSSMQLISNPMPGLTIGPGLNPSALQLPRISSTTNTPAMTLPTTQPPPAHQNVPISSQTPLIGHSTTSSPALMRSLSTPGLPPQWQGLRNLLYTATHAQQQQTQQQQQTLHHLQQQQQGMLPGTPGLQGQTTVTNSNNMTTGASSLHNAQSMLDQTSDASLFVNYTYHTMFIARVLVGQFTQGTSNIKRPPPIDPCNEFGKLYDSCVDNPMNPAIFVVFEPQQSYPEYILEYRARKDL